VPCFLTLAHPRRRPASLSLDHSAGQTHEQLPIPVRQFAEQKVELIQVAPISFRQTSRSLLGACASGKNGRLVSTVFFINEVKYRHFKRPGKSCECFKRRDRMPILYAGDVVAEKAGALLHVYLRKRLAFTQRTQSLADNHFGPLKFGELQVRPGPVLGRAQTQDWKDSVRSRMTGCGRSEGVAPNRGGR
jgi:hypothetical protein